MELQRDAGAVVRGRARGARARGGAARARAAAARARTRLLRLRAARRAGPLAGEHV